MKTIQALLFLTLMAAAQQSAAQVPGPPPGAAQGRPGGTVKGVVVDDASGEAIPSSTVSLWRTADSTLATGALTDLDGRFTIEGLSPGRYYARVSYVGYEPQTLADVALRPGAMEADLGTVRLVATTAFLEGVEVTGERAFVEVGIDRTVYNTRDQLVAAGGSATDVLQNIPSVEVDLDGRISLRGNQNVAVLINGRPAPMTGDALTSFLQGLPADQVERIEVIPNPSAKYEPDGMAGMLNIVLRQNRDLGLNGSLSLGAQTAGNYNASGNLSYNKGRVTFNTGYSFRLGSRSGEGWRTRVIQGATDGSSAALAPFLGQESWDDGSSPGHNLNTSVEYRLDKLNSLSLSGMASRRLGNREGVTAYTARDLNDIVTSQYERLTSSEQDDWDTDFRLAFRRVVEPSSHEFTAELRYEMGWDNDFDRYAEAVTVGPDGPRSRYETETNEQDERDQETSLQIDYVRPVLGAGRLEAGYKGSYDRLFSDFASATFNPVIGSLVPDPVDEFNYDLQIHAAYGTLGARLGRFGLQGGLRAEQTLTDFDFGSAASAFEKNYFSLFPSAYVTYSFTDTRTLKLAYSKRINRPRTGGWFNQLNPFSRSQDTLFVFVGNPALMPEYTHAFEASLTQFTEKTSLTLTPFYRRTVDVIRALTQIDRTTGVTTTTFQNLDVSSSWGAELIGTLRLGQRMNGFASVNVYQVVVDGSNVDTNVQSDALGFSMRFNATFNLRPGLDLQASYFYRAPMEVEFGRQAAQSMSDLALRYKLLGDRASLSLRVNDVFDTAGFRSWNFQNNVEQEVARSFDARRVGLSFQYNFGRAPRNNRRDRSEQPRMDEDADIPQIQF